MDAYPDCVVAPFLRPEPGYGRKQGQSLTITRIGKLGRAGTVEELQRLPTGRPPITTHAVTVKEWGHKIELTEFETDITHFELEDKLKDALREQITLTVDFMCSTALKLTPIKFVPKVASQTFTTNGTPVAGAADRNMNVSDIGVLRDYARQTLKAPPFRDGKYACILSTRAARGIKNDPIYKDWNVFRVEQTKTWIKSYLVSFEDVDFYESNNEDAIADLAGASTVLGEALFLCGDPAGLAVIRDPELRVSPKTVDLGRFWELGWVGTQEAFLSWNLASNARVIHITSA